MDCYSFVCVVCSFFVLHLFCLGPKDELVKVGAELDRVGALLRPLEDKPLKDRSEREEREITRLSEEKRQLREKELLLLKKEMQGTAVVPGEFFFLPFFVLSLSR